MDLHQYAGFLVAVYKLLAASCGMSFPEQGWKRRPSALGAQTLSPWTTKEVSIGLKAGLVKAVNPWGILKVKYYKIPAQIAITKN